VRFMVGREPGESKSSGLNFLRWTFAFGVGFASVALVLSVHSLQSDGRLPDYYFEAAPQIAQGLNLVNVTLVDFRALDTLVESLVVILACMGVAGVLTGREWLTRTRADRNESM
jgi:multisubunit Na+/H+ antiporter MnhB subunit